MTVTGWRDTAGTLWTPNTSVMVNSNSLKFNGNLQIASCAWLRGVAGTQTRLVTMPPDGLSIPAVPSAAAACRFHADGAPQS